MTKRYFLTGSGLIIFLIVAVLTSRHIRGTASLAPASSNLKVKGPQNAPVHLVLYSDFQCPACKNAVAPVEELRTQFSDSLQIEFRHFPLERPHKWALTAATFAQCAAQQNKFWPFHDRLFQSQEIWASSADPIPIFAEMVQEMGLNTNEFESCVQSPQTLVQIRKEHLLGEKQGVQSTPTIFINGHMLVGSLQLKQNGPTIIMEELNKKKNS